MFIGIDDTDSLDGMCTTYLAALLCEKLDIKKIPKLIRLNPNIPYKTRGNGAISLQVDGENYDHIRETVLDLVRKHAHIDKEGTNPGIVFIKKLSQRDRKILENFYKKAMSEIVSIRKAEEIAEKVNAEVHRFNDGRGIIGALAAIGSKLRDSTYELLAYRIPKNYSKERKIDKESVLKMNRETYPETFDNIDPETGQVLITPRGKGSDPVFCGIRGETPEAVEKAWTILKPLEEIRGTQIFQTNQGTDAHLRRKKVSEIRAYDCVILKGRVSVNPKTISGGHVIFGFADNSGEIMCAAYEPTGRFKDTVRKLISGDKICVYGGIGRYPNTVNLEKIKILELSKKYKRIPPECCSRRMTSAGKGKGFKCRRCGKRLGEDSAILKEISRGLNLGFYEVPPRARRHLSMPLVRIKCQEKNLGVKF